ncbi:hypothetical protein FPG59_07855 [Flavobacterium sp. FPG59]|nr:hypothetical protein FPG59_07855 [Flavobacterium sp. FPG59]
MLALLLHLFLLNFTISYFIVKKGFLSSTYIKGVGILQWFKMLKTCNLLKKWYFSTLNFRVSSKFAI